jgi:hypothetical protein
MRAESDHEWYVFVLLGPDSGVRPRCCVVPRNHAVAAAWIMHMDWLTDPDAVRSRNDGEVRVRHSEFVRYEERWDLLDQPTDRVPVLLPPRYKALMREARIAFPRWHPWSDSEPSDWSVE